MLIDPIERPFDSIESAQAFMEILASFKLKTLTCYIHKSRRALNDLRILRRLILNERMTVEHAMANL
jgi:hypothetical protein